MKAKGRNELAAEDELYTKEGAAAWLKVRPDTVKVWIYQKRIGHVKIGRAVRIPKSEIERFIAEGFHPAAERSR